jgi:transcriptional regulator with XRE-family HTH domain
MASAETNDAKRVVMRTLVVALQRDKGWSTAQLAVWMGVTPGTVARWRSGDSMGTNDQRAQLARLGSSRDETPRILEAAAFLEVEAVKSEEQLAKERAEGQGSPASNRRRDRRIARIRQRANDLRRLFPRL